MNLGKNYREKDIFIHRIIEWGIRNRRDFPWRRETDAFRILIAELLLQRSRANSVAVVYERLFSRWPTVESLAEASLSELKDLIRPLGLVKRATTIKNIAQEIVNQDGIVPASVEELQKLPGIGRYVASATIVGAYNGEELLLDSVTARVYRRFFGVSPFTYDSYDAAASGKGLWDFIERIIPKQGIRELNWAVLDLAASICIPEKPRCQECLLKQYCAYHQISQNMRVAELFAGVGGFRLGLEASGWKIVWSNQWEPTTKKQHASDCYLDNFGPEGHVLEDISKVMDAVESGSNEILDFDLLVGGFPCQDYSVARTLNHAVGIVGKKGVLWWEIYRMLRHKKPKYIFLENVDRLLKSPANQKGRDFAVMLACLSDLGYVVEWRVVNSADYGFPQKRRRVFIVGYKVDDFKANPVRWIIRDGVLAKALTVTLDEMNPKLMMDATLITDFHIDGDIATVSDNFGKSAKVSPFENAGLIYKRDIWTRKVSPNYRGRRLSLKDILQRDEEVNASFYVPESQLDEWRYLKGAKHEERFHKPSGTRYYYTEGSIPFPDDITQPARTIMTGEGGSTPSRFKHIIKTNDGRYRRLTPIELERINGFPDGWTDKGIPDARRAFLMGNALVVGVVECIGRALADFICKSYSEHLILIRV